ncbi:MAG: phosphoribosylamine--glycine ligase [Chloroflexota bacterium]
MRVMIVGGGAREHAIAWKIARDRPDTRLFLAPGSRASHQLGQAINIAQDDVAGLLDFARANAVDLTVVGPETALAAGIADEFSQAGLRLFGPSRAAAEIEFSKAWAKDFMRRHAIPTAASASFDTPDAAIVYVKSLPAPPVVKDDAPAGGKGVTVAETVAQAEEAVQAIFAAPGPRRVVVEERLEGWELSALAFCDGRHLELMPPACDYKRLWDGDEGPNTGGMGAYAPASIAPRLRQRIVAEILQPAADGLIAEGRPFQGVLYAGLMIGPDGPKALEFNCRFGDPETQALLPLLESDLLDILMACHEGRLDSVSPRWSAHTCCAVVRASAGYPTSAVPGEPEGLEHAGEALAFGGGSSGRVLTLSATGSTLPEARERVYLAMDRIRLPGGTHRRDIGLFDRASEAMQQRNP